MQTPVTTHPELAAWLAALALEAQEPHIAATASLFVLEVAGKALVTSPAYEKLAAALKAEAE